MLFVTETFLIYFVLVYIGYWLLPARYRPEYLIAVSLYFYATWSPVFAVHFIVLVAVNYYTMEIWREYQKKWLFVGLQVLNVLNLVFFKYFYFLADVIGLAAGIPGLREPVLAQSHRLLGQEILLPLAISFYTFQVMAYGIDIYRGFYAQKHTFRDVLVFKLFFPQLIAGPIMRSHELLPQVVQCRQGFVPDAGKMRAGLWLIIIGVLKKLVVADSLAEFARPVLMGGGFSASSSWLAVFALMFMLYADFSAYSDLARGVGLLLGFQIPINFKAPFFFHSLSDFWRRWHLTFSLWIRDYIFIPLGGSRVTEGRLYFNLIFTFFLGGLWHGASYTFVVWGLITGVLLSIEAFLDRRGVPEAPASFTGKVIRGLAAWTYFVPLTPLFFAPTLERTGSIYKGMLGMAGDKVLENPLVVLGGGIAVFFFHLVEEKPAIFERFRRYESILLPALAFLTVFFVLEFSGGSKDFFYFQF